MLPLRSYVKNETYQHLTSSVGMCTLEIQVAKLRRCHIHIYIRPLQFDGDAQDVVRDTVLHELVDFAANGSGISTGSLSEQSLEPQDDVGCNLSLR